MTFPAIGRVARFPKKKPVRAGFRSFLNRIEKGEERGKVLERIEREMKEAAKELDFERATELRDILFELQAER